MPEAVVKALITKIDPGSKYTGIVLVDNNDRVLFAAEIEHRGLFIKNKLDSRRVLRRGRRGRNTRYRQPRFLNRTRPDGWLPPSLQHRLLTTMTWIDKFRRYAEISKLAVERVKFDMQKMQNPGISGVEYQQGTLAGYEMREYLLEKWNRTCAYCGKQDIPLEIEHIHPKSKGGSNRISNLTLACRSCNEKKGNMLIEEFLKNKPDVLKIILAQAKAPLKDAAAVNATRNMLFKKLLNTGLLVETGTGAQTKFNRIGLKLPKEHWIDAACVGDSGCNVKVDSNLKPLKIKATGHGNRRMCSTNKYGFPIQHRTNKKFHFGFQTGDIVKAVVTKGKNIGIHIGKVMCRAKGNFDVQTLKGKIGASYKNCSILSRKDGYIYNT